MNKKLLLAATALAALTACNNNDFENLGSTNAAEGASPVQFEVLNNNEAMTRASMDGNTIQWSAADGDLFTLYHGADLGKTAGFQNATYKASSEEGAAILSTPSMITAGGAIMVWPVDTAFNYNGTDLTIKIPAVQTNIENNIPYVSDLIEIGKYDGTKGAPNTAGYNRTYPVYMRPMASQLIVKADYAGTDETIAALYDGGSACPADGGIEPISVTSVVLKAGDDNKFTTNIKVAFTDTTSFNKDNGLTPGKDGIKNQWNTSVASNAWSYVTSFGDVVKDDQKNELTTKCLTGNESCKFLILPQAKIDAKDGVAGAGVVVNTIYGKVVVDATNYSEAEYKDSWYRYITDPSKKDADEAATTTIDADGKTKVTANIAKGMKQTLNGFSGAKASKGVVKGESVGVAATRYVKVLLNKLDMQNLHITSDKQLRDAAVVWKYLNPEATKAVEVILDGDEDGEFAISQNTIKFINTLKDEDGNHLFKVKPCTVDGEACKTIVITDGGDIQDIAFIVKNAGTQADVALEAEKTWNWKGATDKISIVKIGEGVKSIINNGTLVNAATATLKNFDAAGKPSNVELVNKGTWNITAGTLNVQFSVTNLGTVNISKGAQYRQDGDGHIFTNDATTLPKQFITDPKVTEEIGKVVNNGVFATVNSGKINNYGLIEHADKDAMTFITSNEIDKADFTTAFDAKTNKMGRINLPYGNKNEDNISISAEANQGFVSVTVTSADAPATKNLDASVVGKYVNFVIVESGISQITAVSNKIKYVEINQPGTMIDWEPQYDATLKKYLPFNYEGLIVLSDVNIKLGTEVNATTTYLGADMYVGGTFNKDKTSWNGYFGNTKDNVATKYITFK